MTTTERLPPASPTSAVWIERGSAGERRASVAAQPRSALGLAVSPAYEATAAASTAALQAALTQRPRSRALYGTLIADAEAMALWDMANFSTLGKLGYNDHGPLHARLTGAAAVHLLDLLVAAGNTPDILDAGIGEVDDATLVVLAGGMLHDVGNALHRDGQAANGVILADPLLRRLLSQVYPDPRQAHLIRVAILSTINSHDLAPAPLTLEAAIVAAADALDVTAGRGQVAFARGKIDIHALSAMAIDRVTVSAGTERPIRIDVDMRSEAGIFQLEQTLLRKLLGTQLRDLVDVRACVGGVEAQDKPRVIDCVALVNGRLMGASSAPH